MRLMGLRFDVVAKDDIYYVILYDIDKEQLDQHEIEAIDNIMHLHQISYLLYKTKNGYHIIGLTPLNNFQWSSVFGALKGTFHSYHGGVVIRLSRKPDENQVLIKLEETYGQVIPNLLNVFATRFGLQKKPWKKEFSKYLLVFETYRTEKI